MLQTDLITPAANIGIILPELIVAFTGVVVMVYDSFFPNKRLVTGALALIGLTASGIALASLYGGVQPSTSWNGMIAHDNLRLSFSFVFLFVSAITVLVSSVWVDREDVPAGEYHALLMFATFGMMMMSAGNDLVVIFLGLETLSISTYVMAGLRKSDLKSNESSMKYFILGSFASAFLLYGMALVYGATGAIGSAAVQLLRGLGANVTAGALVAIPAGGGLRWRVDHPGPHAPHHGGDHWLRAVPLGEAQGHPREGDARVCRVHDEIVASATRLHSQMSCLLPFAHGKVIRGSVDRPQRFADCIHRLSIVDMADGYRNLLFCC